MSVRTTGVILVGTYPWTNSAFDRLGSRAFLPVAHRPVISYSLSWLLDAGISDVAVCANRETRMLEERLHRNVPPGMTFSYHEDGMPRGAAGAVRDAAMASKAELFVVADGTAIPTVDLSDLLRAHTASEAAVTVVVHAEPGRQGLRPMQIPSGVYVFNRKALEAVPASGFCDIKENLIPQLHRSDLRVSAYSTRSGSPRVLNASSYLAANEWMVEQLVASGAQPDGYERSGNSLVHLDAVVAGDATFVGPVLVGAGAQVMSGAVVVGPTSIGCEAVVGAGVLVSRSAIWRRALIRQNAVADRCILGDDAVVSSGRQMFGHIEVATTPRERVSAHQRRPEVQDAVALELLRRTRRARLDTVWSRSQTAP